LRDPVTTETGTLVDRDPAGDSGYGGSMTGEPFTRFGQFKDAARALECDDDAERFRERVAKLVKHKPVEKPE
jgi:hypothetical protein